MHTKGHQQVLVPVLNCPKELYFWSTDHFLLFVYIYHMSIVMNCSYHTELLAVSLHIPFSLRYAFWNFWPNWLLFLFQHTAQASLPPGCLLGSVRLGPPSAFTPLCVSIIVIIILHRLCTYFLPPVDQDPLEKWFICSFILVVSIGWMNERKNGLG